MTAYQEIPDAFPDDYRDSYPITASVCKCGHDEGEHDMDGECQIRRCPCDHFEEA